MESDPGVHVVEGVAKHEDVTSQQEEQILLGHAHLDLGRVVAVAKVVTAIVRCVEVLVLVLQPTAVADDPHGGGRRRGNHVVQVVLLSLTFLLSRARAHSLLSLTKA